MKVTLYEYITLLFYCLVLKASSEVSYDPDSLHKKLSEGHTEDENTIIYDSSQHGKHVSTDAVGLYQKLFKTKRVEHLAAVKSILKMEKFEKQYKMVQSICGAMEKVLQESRLELQHASFTPGDPFPAQSEQEKLKEALSRVLENSALFADMALRLPDVSGQFYRKNRVFKDLIDWALVFSNSTGFYDPITSKLMHLAGQELNLVERDPEFTNPYRATSTSGKTVTKSDKPDEKKKPTKPKKNFGSKGPKIGGLRKEDL